MTKTSALKVGSKLEWDCYVGQGPTIVVTVTYVTKGKVFVEWRNEHGDLIVNYWSRRELNKTRNIRVLSV